MNNISNRINTFLKYKKNNNYLDNNIKLNYINEGKIGKVYSIENKPIIIKKILYKNYKKWINKLNKKNILNDEFLGNEIKISNKITKYAIKYKIPFYPLFYGFNIIYNKNDNDLSEICLYYEEIKNSYTLGDLLPKIKIKKTIENIFLQLLISLYFLNKKLNINHKDIHFYNILIVKNTKINKNEYDIYNINNKNFYIPNNKYKIYLIDYGRSVFNNNNKLECYHLKQQRVRYIIEKFYSNTDRKILDEIIIKNNIKKEKNSSKYYLNKFPKNYKNTDLLYLIGVYLVKYNKNLINFNLLPKYYLDISLKLEKNNNLCSSNMIEWIYENFKKYTLKPKNFTINNIIKI